MKQLANALEKRSSFKDRLECLTESLDHLSFDSPNMYSLLYREMKRRELESNDPNKIIKWLSASQPSSYVKLHEALMMVKNHNVMAKEEYLDSLKQMLTQTIENGTDIEVAIKICSLIERSAHLKSIHEHLVHYIQKVKQLNKNKRFKHKETPLPIIHNSTWNMHSKQTNIGPFERLNVVQSSHQIQPQQRHIPVWPTMLSPSDFIQTHSFPYCNLECNGYDHLGMIGAAGVRSPYDFSQTVPNITIVSQDMDGIIGKWLHYLKIHKYQWFFNELSYLEIEFIDEDNIEGFISKVNKNSITKGAQKKICISTKTLRDRQQKFKDLLMALDLEVIPSELCEIITYMRDILHYPIPNKNCVVGDQIQQDIVLIMEKYLNQLLEKLGATRLLVAQSLLGSSINKYLECSMLITGNQIFMKHQVEKIAVLAETLKYKVNRMHRNFN